MKIEFAEATGCPYGQFVVKAESTEDMEILKRFMVDPPRRQWKFWNHGHVYSTILPSGRLGISSFNFGWVRTPQDEEPCRAAECPLTPKRRMLFLDDRTKRIESARRQYGEKWDLTIVTNVKECLRKMSEEDWDEIHLDHDLNGEDFQDPYDRTAGMEIVRYIEICGWPDNKRKPIFRVHSSNIFAAFLMVKTLQHMGLIAVWERFTYDEETK